MSLMLYLLLTSVDELVEFYVVDVMSSMLSLSSCLSTSLLSKLSSLTMLMQIDLQSLDCLSRAQYYYHHSIQEYFALN